MAKQQLTERRYDAGQWMRAKVEANWHFILIGDATTPTGFHEDDVTYGSDGSITLRADAVQWASLDYMVLTRAASR